MIICAPLVRRAHGLASRLMLTAPALARRVSGPKEFYVITTLCLRKDERRLKLLLLARLL
jgi:hypothetical protein